MILLIGCAEEEVPKVDLALMVEDGATEAFAGFIAHLPLSAEVNGKSPATWTVSVTTDLDCVECYQLEGSGTDFTVHAGDVLGAQYGVAALLEAGGVRFFHPFETHVPSALPSLDDIGGDEVHPQIAERGLHLHTLHPIEAMDAFWSDTDTTRAEAILDWVVKTRGNYVQWVGLDDITGYPVDWQTRTASINDTAHARGLRTGLGIQLFGSSNLQLAFDLIDAPSTVEENRAQVEERLAIVTNVGFDHMSLSFGEFSGVDPEAFIANVDLAWTVTQEQNPALTMSTTIHVGVDNTVTYQGEEMIYYFLAQFADPDITPWVHSVMYYDLYEDAGGAYGHEEFSEHRAFLEERVAAGSPVGYHPESAYWVAFDDSVPTWLPLYMRSRWVDLDAIAQVGTLPSHVLFSTGWEWGYWQNDYATMRMTHTLVPWEDEVRAMYAPWGDDGAALAEIVIAVAEAEHAGLLEGRLAGFVAGRDAVMDVGYANDIISQPERITFAELAASDAETRAAFGTTVTALDTLAAELQGMEAEVETLVSRNDDRWFREVRDGLQITRLRVAYAAALWGATAGDSARLDEADSLFTEAQTVVARRYADMHDTEAATWVAESWDNPTIYDWGYLRYANDLCYWSRDRAQAREAVLGTEEDAPTCI